MLIWSFNFKFFSSIFYEFLHWIFLSQIWKNGMLSSFPALNVHLENMNHICCKQFTCSCLNYAKLINIICKIYKKKERKKNKERFIREICTFFKTVLLYWHTVSQILEKIFEKIYKFFWIVLLFLKNLNNNSGLYIHICDKNKPFPYFWINMLTD